MPKPLVIVESPAKARTIAGFLGRDFVVESSIGHIRDLPRRAADVPAAYKNEPWARLGVDVDNGFKPLYVLSSEKRQQVAKLRSLLKDASELYLATDEDREGESIAWHLLEVLGPQVPVKRMVFHEITAQAIRHAVDDWRDLDRRLVDAQEARRILDRLYGLAGGGAEAAVLVAPRDGRRPTALRERLHHLHAHRQHDAVGRRDRRRPRPGAPALRRRVRAR